MRILDSTLTFSNLAVATQSHQLLLSGIKDPNNNFVVALLTLINILLTTTIITINSNRTAFNSTLQNFSQWIQLSLYLACASFLCTATLNKAHVTNMSKLTNKNTNKISKNLTPSNLQLTLNTCNTSLHCSIKRYAATTQIKVSEYP